MNWEKIWKFTKAALIRALRTFAQTASGMITVGALLNDIEWTVLLSASAVAAIYSILTSIATGLPEVPPEKENISDFDIERMTK